jgi:hypothetical protein
LIKDKPDGKRVVNLINAVREISAIFPGDRIKMIGEKPAIYLGAIEVGDIQVDYIQMHAFQLFDGLLVVLQVPFLNRRLGKLLY